MLDDNDVFEWNGSYKCNRVFEWESVLLHFIDQFRNRNHFNKLFLCRIAECGDCALRAIM